ncbi:MAG: hypothetical protein QOE90_1941 [Thermoplasmata archaeon]|jgi:hypothetical protein|nr:hypothetical protein [Thermoplasmata archaeon]
MVQPQEDRNREIMQRREPEPSPGVGRPPYPNEVIGNEQPPYEVVGLDALSPILLHVPFPADAATVASTIGEARIALDARRTIRVADILPLLGPTEFATQAAFEDAVRHAWTRIRDAAGHAGERGGR